MPRHEERHGSSTRLYVGRLSSRTRSRDLEDIFGKYGRVRDVDMKRDYAFVEFSDPRDADDARYHLNGREVDGSRITVELAKGRLAVFHTIIMDTYIMENGETRQDVPSNKIIEIFRDFMTRVAKFEELVTIGSRLLVGFKQALGFIGRLPIEKSALIERIMKAHGTKRLLSYVETGCLNPHDNVKNMSQLHTCHLGLKDDINKANIVLMELKCLLDDVGPIVQLAKEQHEYVNPNLYDSDDKEDLSPPSEHSKPKVVDYAATMAIIYSMVKQDYNMQDNIVSSLSLKSSPGELETYCHMWSLRPYIDDDMMHQAWILIP